MGSGGNTPPKPAGHPRLRLFLVFLGALFLFVLLLFLLRAPILTGLARLWVVNDPLQKADAIVVLGGGLQDRPFEAARLYHAGYAPKVLLMNPKPSPTTELKLTLPDWQLARMVLYKKEVPETNILVAPRVVSSTFEETLAVKEWAISNHVQKVIIPTGIFHTRRARWIFQKTLRDSPVQVIFVGITPQEYSITDWWQHEEGLIDFQNEILKLIFYHLKY
jgi:uncharacterized SAM-binding protein YcdF (DUF218 family)